MNRPGTYDVRRYKHTTNHTLHVVLCIFTAGAWLIVYLPLVAWRAMHRKKVYHYHF